MMRDREARGGQHNSIDVRFEISPEYVAVSLQMLADLGLEAKLIDG
jgi:hypothetical protein